MKGEAYGIPAVPSRGTAALVLRQLHQALLARATDRVGVARALLRHR